MRFKIFISFLLITLTLGAAAGRALAQDENVRGAFLTSRTNASVAGASGTKTSTGSRPAAKSSPSKSPGAQTRKSPNRPANKNVTAKGAGASVKNNSGGATVQAKAGAALTNTSTAIEPSAPIGLGYTLYMRDDSGDAVRVDPSREFRAGERIRISLEANTDGYLYVFHTENSSNPVMIFPDVRLNEGDNRIEAHVPYEVPSSAERDERLRWFVFDAKPAAERLYIVVTREPLRGVPTGEELITYCHTNKGRCPWRPESAAWTLVQASVNARVTTDKSKTYGQAQTSSEKEATTRGIGLDQSAPEPSVIRMNVLSTERILVTALDLIHR